jgi:CPA1 family monovalent cation:H+ antiporter
VISLAAIFTLPLVTDSGATFPDRDLLLFCTFVVVLVTLVGQGLTFAPNVRALGLRANEIDQARLRNESRSTSVEAALAALDELEAQEHDDIDAQVIETMRGQLRARLTRYRGRLVLLRERDSANLPVSPRYEAALHVRRGAIDAQREELLRGGMPAGCPTRVSAYWNANSIMRNDYYSTDRHAGKAPVYT